MEYLGVVREDAALSQHQPARHRRDDVDLEHAPDPLFENLAAASVGGDIGDDHRLERLAAGGKAA
jgi:hypothetical protein